MVFITVVESVYSAVRTDSLYRAEYISSLKGSNGRNLEVFFNTFSVELKNACVVIYLQDYVFWSYAQEINWAYSEWNSG